MSLDSDLKHINSWYSRNLVDLSASENSLFISFKHLSLTPRLFWLDRSTFRKFYPFFLAYLQIPRYASLPAYLNWLLLWCKKLVFYFAPYVSLMLPICYCANWTTPHIWILQSLVGPFSFASSLLYRVQYKAVDVFYSPMSILVLQTLAYLQVFGLLPLFFHDSCGLSSREIVSSVAMLVIFVHLSISHEVSLRNCRTSIFRSSFSRIVKLWNTFLYLSSHYLPSLPF